MATTTHLAGAALGPAGERALRAALFERILERIHRYFARLVWDATAVDDCVQQTLLALERSLQQGTYDPARSFNRWMWIKAHTAYVEHCRARARAPGPLPDDADRPTASAEGEVDARLDAPRLLTHLRARLDPEAFEMFVLFYGEGHNVSEVAAITQRDRKTVRKRLQDGKALAVAVLGER